MRWDGTEQMDGVGKDRDWASITQTGGMDGRAGQLDGPAPSASPVFPAPGFHIVPFLLG